MRYVFLKQHVADPFGNIEWVAPTGSEAQWVSSSRGGAIPIHACRVADLPYWLNDELWEVELREPVVDLAHGVTSQAARLVRQVPNWSAQHAISFADVAVRHARDMIAEATTRDVAKLLRALDTIELLATLAKLGDSAVTDLNREGLGAVIRMLGESADDLRLGQPALAVHEAAVAVGMLAAGGTNGDPHVFEAGMRKERQWQATKLYETLELDAAENVERR
jgi:hypothetical protein